MKNRLLDILNNYIKIFEDEQERQSQLMKFLKEQSYEDSIDWNNFDGHLVASGFIYCPKKSLFLVLYHKDLKTFLYPGGHIDKDDANPLEAAIRETKEETGLVDFKPVNICEDSLVPIDIDTHIIDYNERLDLPAHYHYDFRYLFIVDDTSEVEVDTEELGEYKWIELKELYEDKTFFDIAKKIEKFTK